MSIKTLSRKKQGHSEQLREDEDPFSTNKVTRWSLNFPIIGTCSPTRVCSERCYFAKGPSTWSASLAKQHRLLNSLRADPVALGHKIVVWVTRHRMSFVRWCGGGDLVEEAPACIDCVACCLPDVPQWVVTRKPEVAATIKPRSNVYVHLSTDKSSPERLAEFARLAPPDLRWFWSYQCEPKEVPDEAVAPVIFRDGYDLDNTEPRQHDCPLNHAESIVRVCESCRRCFDGTALRMATECQESLRSSLRLFG